MTPLLISTLALSAILFQNNITGRVLEFRTQKPLQGVMISVIGHDLTARSDSSGYFNFPQAPSGKLTLRFSLDGYVTTIYRNIPEEDQRRGPLVVHLSKTPFTQDGIRIYVPDSTIEYKLRTYDPTKRSNPNQIY